MQQSTSKWTCKHVLARIACSGTFVKVYVPSEFTYAFQKIHTVSINTLSFFSFIYHLRRRHYWALRTLLAKKLASSPNASFLFLFKSSPPTPPPTHPCTHGSRCPPQTLSSDGPLSRIRPIGLSGSPPASQKLSPVHPESASSSPSKRYG